MNPWTIIGWAVIVLAAIPVLLWAAVTIPLWLAARAMHRRTRDDEPQAGDVWIEGSVFTKGTLYRIKHVFDDGVAPGTTTITDENGRAIQVTDWTGKRISIEIDLPGGSKGSWGETREKWRERVKRQKLWRSKP